MNSHRLVFYIITERKKFIIRSDHKPKCFVELDKKTFLKRVYVGVVPCRDMCII